MCARAAVTPEADGAPTWERPRPLTAVSPEAFSELISSELDGHPRDLMAYVHIPFCSSKCHFCDFVADMPVPDLISGMSARDRYVAAICRQIAEYGPRLTELGFRVRLVYWGGGTPTRLEPAQLSTISQALASAMDLSGTLEYSVECSPETVTVDKVRALRNSGADRISVGVQSFVDSELRMAGRAHSSEQAVSAPAVIRAGGVQNVNLDLIAGFPTQRIDGLRHSIGQCIALEPTHVTVYPYRADPRTVMARQLGRGDRPAVQSAHLFDAVSLAREMLLDAGYEEYSVGSFAQPGYRFLGESYYFDLAGDIAGHFFGFGAGAGSTVGHYGFANPHATFRRFQDDPLTFETAERYSPYNLGMIGKTLRLAMLNWSGIDAQRFEDIFGFPLAVLREQPVFREYIDYFRHLGADIEEDDRGLRISGATQSDAHLRSYRQAEEYIYAPTGSQDLQGPQAPGPLT